MIYMINMLKLEEQYMQVLEKIFNVHNHGLEMI